MPIRIPNRVSLVIAVVRSRSNFSTWGDLLGIEIFSVSVKSGSQGPLILVADVARVPRGNVEPFKVCQLCIDRYRLYWTASFLKLVYSLKHLLYFWIAEVSLLQQKFSRGLRGQTSAGWGDIWFPSFSWAPCRSRLSHIGKGHVLINLPVSPGHEWGYRLVLLSSRMSKRFHFEIRKAPPTMICGNCAQHTPS